MKKYQGETIEFNFCFPEGEREVYETIYVWAYTNGVVKAKFSYPHTDDEHIDLSIDADDPDKVCGKIPSSITKQMSMGRLQIDILARTTDNELVLINEKHPNIKIYYSKIKDEL